MSLRDTVTLGGAVVGSIVLNMRFFSFSLGAPSFFVRRFRLFLCVSVYNGIMKNRIFLSPDGGPPQGGAQRQSPRTHFCFLKKRWRPNRTAEPEVTAVHPRRHPPSARKSRLHPLLRLFHAAPCCPLPDGSIRCPTISGCTRSFNRFWT